MNKIDQIICKLMCWARSQTFLYRITLGCRIFLAIGFIPTGIIKMMGLRFTSVSTGAGRLFEVLYQSEYYWVFLGFSQVLASVLILSERFLAIGAIIFFAIITNIVVITYSYDFQNTVIVSSAMLIAVLWLIIWEWYRIRLLIFKNELFEVANLSLFNRIEKGIYITGFLSGLILFSILRGINAPFGLTIILLLLCLVCLVIAAIFYYIKISGTGKKVT